MSSVVSDASAGSGGSFTTIVELTNREPTAIGRRCSKDIRAALAAGPRVVPLSEITPDDSVSVIGQQRAAVLPLGALTPQQVGCLLEALQLGRYSAAFQQLPIRGADLEEVTDDDLKEAGVEISVHRRALLKQVAEFKQSGVPVNLLMEGAGAASARPAQPTEAQESKANMQPPSLPPPVSAAEQEERRRREVARARLAAKERKRQVEDQRQREALAAAQAAEQAKAAAAGAVRIQAVLRGRRSRSLSQELREASAEEQAVSVTIIAHAFGRLLRRRRDALETASAARVALSWRRLQLARRVERRRLEAEEVQRAAEGVAAARIGQAYVGLRQRRSEALEAAAAARRARPWLRLLDLWKAVKVLSSPLPRAPAAEMTSGVVTAARLDSDSLPPDSPCGLPPAPPPRRRLSASSTDGSDPSCAEKTVDTVCAARRKRRSVSGAVAAPSSPPATTTRQKTRAPSAASTQGGGCARLSLLGVLCAAVLLVTHLPGAPPLPPVSPTPPSATTQAGGVLAHARSKPDGACLYGCSGAAAPDEASGGARWLAPLKGAVAKATPEITARAVKAVEETKAVAAEAERKLRALPGAAAAKAAPQLGRVKQWWQGGLRKIHAWQQQRRAGDERALEAPRE